MMPASQELCVHPLSIVATPLAFFLPSKSWHVDAGKLFYYSSADTQALGLVLRGATGVPLADYLGSRI